MGEKYLLGIDNGGTAVKAALYNDAGRELAVARQGVVNQIPADGWLERSVSQVWEANRLVISRVLGQSGVDPADILAVGITGYGNGAFFVGGDQRPAQENCILSGDTRANAYIKKWISGGTQELVMRRTKQTLWAGQTLPLLAWMKDHRPDVMAKTRHVMTCKDYLRMRLTGEAAGEISDLSGISAMDLDTKRLDPEIFRLLGIPEYFDRLPQKILGSTEVGGTVTAEAARLTGLREGTPVVGGLFDITACAIATGIVDDSRICLILGTWSINEYISRDCFYSPDFFLNSLYCMDGFYLHTEGSTTSASNLQWFVEKLLGEEARDKEARGENVFDACEEMLAGIPYDDSPILFLPFLFGTHGNLDAKSAFVGLSGRHTKAHMLRAVYEGIVFSHLHHVQKLYEHRDKPAAARISGGGASSAQWIQMFADVLEIPVEVPASKELGAMGVAMCAGVGAGLYPDLEAAANVFARVQTTYLPNPERYPYYRKKYALYQKLIESLDGVWEQLDELSKNE